MKKLLFPIALLLITIAASAQTDTPRAIIKLIAPDTIASYRGMTALFRDGSYRGFYFGQGERLYFIETGPHTEKCAADNYNLEDNEELAAQIFFCDGTRSTIEIRSNDTDTSPIMFSLRGGDTVVFQIRPKLDKIVRTRK